MAPTSGSPRALRIAYATTFVLALATRLWWVFRVQNPLAAVYSDMGVYVQRADMLLAGKLPGEPRVLAFWPWGTHTIIAGEFWLLGRNATFAIPLLHAVVGAVVAPASAALCARFTGRPWSALLAGCVVALWHPHILYSGYFMSEIWFTTALVLGTLLLVRYAEKGKGALGCGLLLALAFSVRPQILLTVMMVGGVFVLGRLMGRPYLRRARFGIVLLLLPLALTMAGSAIRLHRLTGKVGLIATYEPVQRLFGETDVDKIEASWSTANGDRWTWWFNPPTKKPIKTVVTFEGFICDQEILGKILRERLAKMTFKERVLRKIDNVSMLVLGNEPWPESELPVKNRFRKDLQFNFSRAAIVVLVLAAGGVTGLGRHRLAALLVRIHLLSIVVVASMYLGEARYRVPFDPFLIIAAVVGLGNFEAGLRRIVRGLRRRFATQK